MTGNSGNSLEWARNRLNDIDPRTRANAVEALWGRNTDYVRALLRSAARDSNNRVAGNALFALYGAGEIGTIQDLLKMALSEVPRRRASAAWAMGQTGDRRFVDALGCLAGDANVSVRKRAFSALEKVRNAVAKTRLETEWRVSATVLPSLEGVRRVAVEAGPSDGCPLSKLVATQFVLTEGGHVVYNYRLEDRSAREGMAVSFLFPHTETAGPWTAGAVACLGGKGPTDLWRTVYFVERESEAAAPPDPPPLASEAATAAAALERQPGKDKCRDFWNSISICLRAKAPTRCLSKLVVYCPVDPGVPADAPEIISDAARAKVVVQAIASGPNTALEDLCRITDGNFQLATPGDDVSTLMQEAYRTLPAPYLITYEPVAPAANSLYIWVSNSTGWGETTIAL